MAISGSNAVDEAGRKEVQDELVVGWKMSQEAGEQVGDKRHKDLTRSTKKTTASRLLESGVRLTVLRACLGSWRRRRRRLSTGRLRHVGVVAVLGVHAVARFVAILVIAVVLLEASQQVVEGDTRRRAMVWRVAHVVVGHVGVVLVRSVLRRGGVVVLRGCSKGELIISTDLRRSDGDVVVVKVDVFDQDCVLNGAPGCQSCCKTYPS
mmetsp:Transcript_35876/g.90398  ORF Transcript_35876/g.90398 Transcript_35876/m.90398 type:complete len:208 (-) Transcript_35876:901-1524(-)